MVLEIQQILVCCNSSLYHASKLIIESSIMQHTKHSLVDAAQLFAATSLHKQTARNIVRLLNRMNRFLFSSLLTIGRIESLAPLFRYVILYITKYS